MNFHDFKSQGNLTSFNKALYHFVFLKIVLRKQTDTEKEKSIGILTDEKSVCVCDFMELKVSFLDYMM